MRREFFLELRLDDDQFLLFEKVRCHCGRVVGNVLIGEQVIESL
jgi:hypothetical protein